MFIRRTWLTVLILTALPSALIAAERYGKIDMIHAKERILVIHDVPYRLAAGLVVTQGDVKNVNWQRTLRPGQNVYFTIDGAGDEPVSTIATITVLSKPPDFLSKE